jgi:subtilisin family serine protease
VSNIDPRLQHAREVWQHKLENLEASDAAESAVTELRDTLATVVVDFVGDIAALREAGMDTGFDNGGRVAGHIAFKDLDRLDAVPGVQSIALVPQPRPALDGTVPEARVPWKVAPQTFSGTGVGVIVAVVDTGIDVYHESFRNNDAAKTTRILELWDQTPGLAGGSQPPAAFQQIGTVYSAADINASLAAGGPAFPSVDTDGHGTHVAGIAAGNGQQDDRCTKPGHYVGVAPGADLVIVKAIGVDTSNLYDALAWCAAAGTRLQQPGQSARPVVINCSFGKSDGPHDGTDLLDGVVDGVLQPEGGPAPQGLAVVVGAGNEGDSQIHESGTIPANGNATVKFSMPPTSHIDDHLEIWYTGTASLTVKIVAPPSDFPPPVDTGDVAVGVSVNVPIGKMTVKVSSREAPMTNKKRLIEATISITNPADPLKPVMRPGIWEIHLTNTSGVDAKWDAWFQNAAYPEGYPTFALPGESGIVARRRDNTTDSPGTSLNAITVANYGDGDGLLAPTSSRGAADQSSVQDIDQRKPTLAAPGMTVRAPRSQKDPESLSCDKKVIDKSGTSMASPHVAGVVALMLQYNSGLTFDQLRRLLQTSASKRHDRIPAAEVPPEVDPILGLCHNSLWGAGKLDAAATIAAMTPAAGGPAGGGKSAPMFDVTPEYVPHTPFSRIGYLQNRFGPRPGLMLLTALCSEHFDEVMRLINSDRRVTLAWRRGGGHLLVRHLLHGPAPANMVLPKSIPGCDVTTLMGEFGVALHGAGGEHLRADLERFAEFLAACPGADLQRLDTAALAIRAPR